MGRPAENHVQQEEPDDNEHTYRKGDGGIGYAVHDCAPEPVSPLRIKGIRGNHEGWVKFEVICNPLFLRLPLSLRVVSV